MEKLINGLLKISKENPNGFTVYLPSLEKVTRGWVIANELTQDCFGIEGLRKVVEFAMNHNRIIGGWFDEGKYYFDAPIIEPNREKAIELMKLYNQLAIINLKTFEIIKR